MITLSFQRLQLKHNRLLSLFPFNSNLRHYNPGERVQITEGSYFNIKVTTPEDMYIAERLMAEQGAAV